MAGFIGGERGWRGMAVEEGDGKVARATAT